MNRSRNQSCYTSLSIPYLSFMDSIHPLNHFNNVSLAFEYLSRVPWTLLTHPALFIRAILKALSKALRREPVTKILIVGTRLATTGRIPFQ